MSGSQIGVASTTRVDSGKKEKNLRDRVRPVSLTSGGSQKEGVII
jgi:hypothetical protein